MADFEFLGTNDKPALICVSSPEWGGVVQAVLSDLDYKPFVLNDPGEFNARFAQIQYQVVVLDESFGGGSIAENSTLAHIQRMPMAQRRHCVFILLSNVFESMNTLQAYQQSVHNIVNYNDLSVLSQVIQKTVSDNTLFYQNYVEIQKRVNQGK